VFVTVRHVLAHCTGLDHTKRSGRPKTCNLYPGQMRPPHSHHRQIYYLPGHGRTVASGLGEELLARGYELSGRETVGSFRALSFTEQVQLIADDLCSKFWRESDHVVANSFGAYLFLHAQLTMKPYAGRVLLLSPIVGEFSSDELGMGFSPPFPTKLRELAKAGEFPAPKQCEIHVGEQDWQSVPSNVVALGEFINVPVTVVRNAGHTLGSAYVKSVLDRWLR
jgi:hypothetical protein